MRIEPYLYFNGRCEEAIEFYRKAIDAEVVTLSRFKDHPGAPVPEGAGDKIMHAQLSVGGASILASDGQCSGSTDFNGFSLSLAAEQDGAAERLFGALAEGGQVQVPMMSTPFASRFGMVADRYGVLWTITSPRSADLVTGDSAKAGPHAEREPMPGFSTTKPATARTGIGGWILSGLVISFLLMDAAMKLLALPIVLQAGDSLGFGGAAMAHGLGAILLLCTALYAAPRTSVLGAILLTGYLGGAVATQIRVGSPLFTHVLFGVYLGLFVWGGLYLRYSSIRALIPARETIASGRRG